MGIEIDSEEDTIDNVISIRRDSDNLELYNTNISDGSFDARVIYLPSDSVGSIDDEVTVFYNKIELFDINKSDGSFYNNIIILPSESILDAEDLLDTSELLYLSGDNIYVRYVADVSSVHSNTSLSNLPITGGDTSNLLIGTESVSVSDANQPIFFGYDDSGDPSSITRFSPSNLKIEVSGISKPGKIKVTGTTVNRYVIDVTAGVSKSGFTFEVDSEIESLLGLTSIPSNIGIARVDKVCTLDDNDEIDEEFDILGYYLNDITYDIGAAQVDSDLENYQFTLPSTSTNSSISVSSGDTIRIYLLLYNSENYEELYFSSSESRISNNRFGRIDRISVSSGFRSVSGNIIGSIKLACSNQPSDGETYYVDYDFLAPKEGERITVSYNVNKLIIDSTVQMERVRPVTADILVKEAEELTVDVEGTLLINDNALSETDKITENVINSVTNLLNTSTLSSIVDYSDIISVAASENGC